MADIKPRPKHLNMLLVEPEALLRRTVSLTARSIGLGTIHEAASLHEAERLLRQRAFQGAVISLDCGAGDSGGYNLALLDKVRDGLSASDSAIPIAVMTAGATAEMLHELRRREVSRVILKPFRARVLLDTFAAFDAQPASKDKVG